MSNVKQELRSFGSNNRGNVTILTAVALTILMGFAGLVGEFGEGLLTQTTNQRISDVAGHQAAVYCTNNATCATTATQNTAIAVAAQLGSLNGLSTSSSAGLTTTFPNDSAGNASVQVASVSTDHLLIAPIAGAPNNLSVQASGLVAIGQTMTPGTPATTQTVTTTTYQTETVVTPTLVTIVTPTLVTIVTPTVETVEVPTVETVEVPTQEQVTTTVSTSPCIVALSSSSALALNGGTSLTAPSCGIASNDTVSVPNGTIMTAKAISYGSVWPLLGCPKSTTPYTSNTNITINGSACSTTNPPVNQTIADPLATATQVTTAEGRLTTVAALTAPSAPTVTAPTASSGGTAWPSALTNLGYYPTATVTDSATKCSASFSNNIWTISGCNPGTYNLTTAPVTSGMGFNFLQSGSSSNVYNFNYAVSLSGTTNFGPGTFNFKQGLTTSANTTFGAGTVNVTGNLVINSSPTTTFGASTYYVSGYVSTTGTTNFGGSTTGGTFNVGQYVSLAGTTTFGSGTFDFVQGLTAGGGTTTTFGSGTFNFGAPTSGNTCTNSAYYSICHTGTTMTFGAGVFTMSKGIYAGGGTKLYMGGGSTSNSFNIGASSDGNSLNFGGGPTAEFGDATCGTCVFQLAGNLTTGGGSCTLISAAAEHDIKGNINVAGGTVLGAGVYTTYGYFAAGLNSGGSVSCPTTFGGSSTNVGVFGNGVTITYGGNNTAYTTGGVHYGFYLSAGFSNIDLVAPTSGATQNLLLAGPASTSSAAGAGMYVGQGAGGVLSGAAYLPVGDYNMSGGAGIVDTGGYLSNPNQCFQIVANTIELTGGAFAASTCISGLLNTADQIDTSTTSTQTVNVATQETVNVATQETVNVTSTVTENITSQVMENITSTVTVPVTTTTTVTTPGTPASGKNVNVQTVQ
ncbi:MAG: hypothetical protein WB816_13810 [Methylocystis sp.]